MSAQEKKFHIKAMYRHLEKAYDQDCTTGDADHVQELVKNVCEAVNTFLK